MEGKLRQLMKHEGINSTRLAEILGIQASGISHIMSGRNKPSFDFLLKLFQRFPQINPDWLLLDRGPMYRDEIKNKSGQNTSGGGGTRSGITGVSGGGSTRSGITGVSGGGGERSGIAGASGGNVSGGRLFEPDNDDIIPSGVHSVSADLSGNSSVAPSGGPLGNHSGGHQGYGSNQNAGVHSGASAYTGSATGSGVYSTHHTGEMGTHSPSGVTRSGAHLEGGQGVFPRHTSGQNVAGNGQAGVESQLQYPVHQSSGFMRSASIERIVVFYKDKTFSEYQPE